MKYNDIRGMTFTCITVVERIDGKWLGKCNRCGSEKMYTYNEIKNKKSNRCSNCKSVEHDDYFDIIDSEVKAYILGFITADGCNYGDGRVKIDLSLDDLDILVKIRDCLGVENDILTYEQPDKIFNGKAYPSKTQKRLNIWNKNICEQLIDKGCVKDKSKYLIFTNEDKVPKELYRHYIRGYFDGNGHLGYWIDNKRTGHKKFNMSVTSTVNFCEKIKDIFSEFDCQPDLRSRWMERNNNNATVSLCGNRVIGRVCDWMYSDATIYLERKYRKYLELLEQNK